MAVLSRSSFVLFFLAIVVVVCLLPAPVQAGNEVFTYYWVPEEKGNCPGNPYDASIVSCSTKQLIANVCSKFLEEITTEGSGHLEDGRYVTSGDGDNCFEVTPEPMGSRDNVLQPFVSIAVPSGSQYSFGSILEITQLKGLMLPNNMPHNGCVRVDDMCPGCNMDFYVRYYSNYIDLDKKLGEITNWEVTPNSNCNINNYGGN